MSLDFARGSVPLLPSLGGAFPNPVHRLLPVLDQVSPIAPRGRGLCGQVALVRCVSLLGCRWKSREFSARRFRSGFRIWKRLWISRNRRTGLTAAVRGVIVCQCRRSGENMGRFEDGDIGSFTDPSLNCQGDIKGVGNGSGWMGAGFDVRDSLKPRPWNGTGDGLRSGILHDHVDIAKKRGWASCSSWAKESASFSSPAGDDRNLNRPRFNATDEFLLRHKASTAGVPISLRMLKRKQVQNRALKKGSPQEASGDACKSHGFLAMAGESTYCSFKKAFSSMVFMIRTLQSCTIHLRKGAFCEDLQEVLAVMHGELHSSFLWLFQQVFACSPKLMLAVMLLLANYTVYSVGNHVALSAVSPPPPVEFTSFEMCVVGSLPTDLLPESGPVSFPVEAIGLENRDSWLSTQTEFSGAGGSSGPIVAVSGSSDGARRDSGGHSSCNRAVFSSQELSQNIVEAHSQGGFDDAEAVGLEAKGLAPSESVALNHERKKSIVAPVRAKLAPDNYSCYDRTELIYQYAICSDSTNALLLANYAQFLFLVRRDHDRAEQFFCRAMKADPTDGHIISRFASFLWLARGDRLAAEKAYRAVVDMDPSNPYFTGCLADFMWHSGECASCSVTQQTD